MSLLRQMALLGPIVQEGSQQPDHQGNHRILGAENLSGSFFFVVVSQREKTKGIYLDIPSV